MSVIYQLSNAYHIEILHLSHNQVVNQGFFVVNGCALAIICDLLLTI